jgi:hypothetical protein
VIAAKSHTGERRAAASVSNEVVTEYRKWTLAMQHEIAFEMYCSFWYAGGARGMKVEGDNAADSSDPRSAQWFSGNILRVCALLILNAVAWYFNTGTLAPYAATLPDPYVSPDTGLLGNWDDAHHMAVMDMLEGKDGFWKGSVVFRRPLHAWLCLPFNRLCDYRISGILLNLVLYQMAMLVLWKHLKKSEGEREGIIALSLLSVYPGFTYWSGMPYCYGLIAPFCIVSPVIVDACLKAESSWNAAAISLFLGVCFLGYDVYVIFIPVLFLTGCLLRKPIRGMICCALSIAPLLAMVFTYRNLGLSLQNDNAEVYSTIARAWLTAPETGVNVNWHLASLAAKSFVFSNFVILPLLFLLTCCLCWKTSVRSFDVALLAIVCGLFGFLNACPEYSGKWQMRGEFMNRLYQPVFISIVCVCARSMVRLRSLGSVLLGLAMLGQASVVFSGILGLGYMQTAYERFYPHADAGQYNLNLEEYGRRPLGFTAGVLKVEGDRKGGKANE